MPYEIREANGRYCVAKQGESGTMKCYDDKAKATAYLRALYANVKDSMFPELSMTIVKANQDKNGVMRWRSVNSDIGEDYYGEKMSKELFQDFIGHINNEDEIPEPFKSVICEEDWCGGMPYISIAHYKSGSGKANVPGEPNKIYLDGEALKSTGIMYDTPLGKAVFKSLQKDLVEKRDDKIRVSIGFLDLEHSHGDKYTFTRRTLTDKCPLCKEGVGDKIYKKGHLVHLALTRVPANPRTDVEVEKSMTTKREDAESIIEDEEVIKGLDLKSQADDVLVIKSDMAVPAGCPCDPGDTACIDKWMNENPSEDAGEMQEEAARKDVTPADKKRAEKEYGDVKYADETNKKYPIDTEEHIRAAWNYIHQERNAAKYLDHGAAVKSKILAAWKRVIGGEPPSVAKSDVEEENTEFIMDSTTILPVVSTSLPIYSDGTVITTSTPVFVPTSTVVYTPIEQSFIALKSKIETIKSQGLTGEKALAEIQSDFDKIGEVIKAEFTPAPSSAEVEKQNLETTLRSLLNEMLPQALAATVAPIQSQLDSLAGELRAKSLTNVPKKEEVRTVQRSLNPVLVQKAVESVAKKSVSQFDLIARQSVGLQ